jgi:hypothetical protein
MGLGLEPRDGRRACPHCLEFGGMRRRSLVAPGRMRLGGCCSANQAAMTARAATQDVDRSILQAIARRAELTEAVIHEVNPSPCDETTVSPVPRQIGAPATSGAISDNAPSPADTEDARRRIILELISGPRGGQHPASGARTRWRSHPIQTNFITKSVQMI